MLAPARRRETTVAILGLGHAVFLSPCWCYVLFDDISDTVSIRYLRCGTDLIATTPKTVRLARSRARHVPRATTISLQVPAPFRVGSLCKTLDANCQESVTCYGIAQGVLPLRSGFRALALSLSCSSRGKNWVEDPEGTMAC